MASTTSVEPGSTGGRNLATTSPAGEMRNFSKFHWMSPDLPLGVGEIGQLLVQRMALGAVDVHLLGYREGDAVGGGAERLNLLGTPRLLAAELVARHAEDGKSLAAVTLLQILETGVLRGKPAFGGDVDDQDLLALQFRQIQG